MSAAQIKKMLASKIGAARETIARNVHAIRYEFPQLGQDGAVVPPPTAENIAMRVVEANAVVRTYDQVLAMLDEAYRELTAPDKGSQISKPKPKREAPYQ